MQRKRNNGSLEYLIGYPIEDAKTELMNLGKTYNIVCCNERDKIFDT